MKSLLLAGLFLLLGGVTAQAANPVRYTQISTNTFTVQSGSINVRGVTTSSITVNNQILLPGTSGQSLISAGPGLPAFFAGSRILQIVSTLTVINKTSTSSSYADSGLQVNITMKSATSVVLVLIAQQMHSGIDSFAALRLIGNGVTLIGDHYGPDITGSGGSLQITVPIIYLDTPGVAAGATIQYKTQFARNGGVGTVQVQSTDNGAVGTSRLILIEVGP